MYYLGYIYLLNWTENKLIIIKIDERYPAGHSEIDGKLNMINPLHNNRWFTMEKQVEDRLPFLDMQIMWSSEKNQLNVA